MIAVVIFVCALLIGCNAYYSLQQEDINGNPNDKMKKINK